MSEKMNNNGAGRNPLRPDRLFYTTTIIQESSKCKQKIPATEDPDHSSREKTGEKHNILWFAWIIVKTTKKGEKLL